MGFRYLRRAGPGGFAHGRGRRSEAILENSARLARVGLSSRDVEGEVMLEKVFAADLRRRKEVVKFDFKDSLVGGRRLLLLGSASSRSAFGVFSGSD